MDNRDIELIESELALLVRLATSLSADKSAGSLDRSAYLLLGQFSARGSAGVRALADEFQLDISTVSRQVSALEQKGFVLRKSDPSDGRAYLFEITEEGRTALQEYKKLRTARISEKLQDWTEEEREAFGRLLRKFNRAFM